MTFSVADKPFHLTEATFHRVRDLIYRHCGIHLNESKKELVRARLAKQIRLGRYQRLEDYLEAINTDRSGRIFSELVDAISTNLTSFFRERSHFDFLQHTFLPAYLAAKRRQGRHRLRVWSAGCSSGEEAYSLALTLSENLSAHEPWDIKILATDISTTVLKTAARGTYDRERIQPIPKVWRQRYLRKAEGENTFQIDNRLKAIVVFRYLNLMKQWPFQGPFDFIFCRNVMIYFDKPTQERLIRRFYDILNIGGALFIGHSESLTGIKHAFHYVQPTIYIKG